jgi:hypothetical protein
MVPLFWLFVFSGSGKWGGAHLALHSKQAGIYDTHPTRRSLSHSVSFIFRRNKYKTPRLTLCSLLSVQLSCAVKNNRGKSTTLLR